MPKEYLKVNWNNTNETLLPTKSTLDNIVTELNNNDKFVYVNELDENEDLNNVTAPGFYRAHYNNIAISLKNSPTQDAFFMIVGTHAGIFQCIVEYPISFSKIFMRNFYDSDGSSPIWGDWQQINAQLYNNVDTRYNTTKPNDYNGRLLFTGLKSVAAAEVENLVSGLAYVTLLGLRGFYDETGGYAHEFCFASGQGFFHRAGNTTSWNIPWSKVLTERDTLALGTSAASARTVLGFSGNEMQPLWSGRSNLISQIQIDVLNTNYNNCILVFSDEDNNKTSAIVPYNMINENKTLFNLGDTQHNYRFYVWVSDDKLCLQQVGNIESIFLISVYGRY